MKLIRNELRDYCYDSILDLSKYNITNLNFVKVKEIIKQHMENRWDYSFEIWNLMMLSQWFRKYYND